MSESTISTIPAILVADIFTVWNACGAPKVNCVVLIAPEKPLAVFFKRYCEGFPLVIWAIETEVGLSELDTEKSIGSSIVNVVGVPALVFIWVLALT